MSTIHRWHEEWLARHEFRPDESKRSRHHPRFTDEQEAEIRAQISDSYFSQHRRLSCREFKGLIEATISRWMVLDSDRSRRLTSAYGINRRLASHISDGRIENRQRLLRLPGRSCPSLCSKMPGAFKSVRTG
jgi:hypothetical protein